MYIYYLINEYYVKLSINYLYSIFTGVNMKKKINIKLCLELFCNYLTQKIMLEIIMYPKLFTEIILSNTQTDHWFALMNDETVHSKKKVYST